jgi:hypothetical protein
VKVTNYNLSKKLAEIGFEAETEKCYDKNGNLISCHRKICFLRKQSSRADEVYGVPAYDLETILASLPRRNLELKFYEHHGPDDQNNIIGYLYPEIWVEQEENESLVDMSAKLLITLHEKGLVKFGGENE